MAYSNGTWFITGTSTGFGKAIAHAVLAKGGRVVATARDPRSVSDLVDNYGDRILALALDVTDRAQIAEAVARADAFGGMDVLVNNAGYGFLGGIEESGDDEIADQMAVNFYGPLHLIRAALPGMRARGRGGFIVNFSSIAGVSAFAGAGFYSASKFALEGLSEALLGEVTPFGIGVMIVEPGYFRTDFAGRSIRKTRHGHSDYPQLAANRANTAQVDGAQPGDPVRGAAVILDAVDSASPPLRLALGSDAIDFCDAALASRKADLARWDAPSRSTDFARG